MRDPLDFLEATYRRTEPVAGWAERLKPRRKTSQFVAPAVAALAAYVFLVACADTPNVVQPLPKQVLERQMADLAPEPENPSVSVSGRRSA